MKYTTFVLCALATSALAAPTHIAARDVPQRIHLDAREAQVANTYNQPTGSNGYYPNTYMNTGANANLGTAAAGSSAMGTGYSAMGTGATTMGAGAMGTGAAAMGTGATTGATTGASSSGPGDAMRNNLAGTDIGRAFGITPTSSTSSSPALGANSASMGSTGYGSAYGGTSGYAPSSYGSYGSGYAPSSYGSYGYPSTGLAKRDYVQGGPPAYFYTPALLPFIRQWVDTGYRGSKRDFDDDVNIAARDDVKNTHLSELAKRSLYYNGLIGFGYNFPVNGNPYLGPVAI